MRDGTITAVQRDPKRPNRYRIYIEGEFAFDVHEDVLVKYRLTKGTAVDVRLWSEVLAGEERHRAYAMALRYLGLRPRTGRQLQAYLQDRGIDPELARETRERCEAEGYLDDEAFAAQWVRERLRQRPRGAYALRQELTHKGISRDIVDRVVGELTADDELEAARRWAFKRLRHRSHPLNAEEERRILAALSRKGFSSDVVSRLRREIRQGGWAVHPEDGDA